MKVLIAEDDSVFRIVLQRSVESFGHECVVAADGAEAWELFKTTPDIDAVISDWMMPRMDGLELCRRVRAENPDEYAYFVLLTALDDREHLLAGIEAGADDYLSKPLDRDELQVRLISGARVTSLHRRLARQNRELEDLARQLHHQSRTDPLTGLGNRLRLREQLEVLDDMAERYGHTYCMVICDVDEFKGYNDHYGHQAGDEVLRQMAAVIAGHCRATDVACRYGGEEFLIVLPQQSREGGVNFAERLRRSIEELGIPHEGKTPTGVITISAGVAAHGGPGQSSSAAELLRAADTALYHAKRAGRNRTATMPPGG